MKKTILLLALFSLSMLSFLFAQTIETGPENLSKNTMRTKGKIIKVSKDGYWVLMMDDISPLTLMNSKYSIEQYDSKMNLISSKKIEPPKIGEKVYDMDYLINSGDDILLLASYEDKTTFITSMKMFKLEKDGTPGQTPLAEWEVEGIKYDKLVIYSPDSSKFAVMLSIIRSRDDKILSMPLVEIDKKAFRSSNFVNYSVFENNKEVYSKKNIKIDHNDLQFMPTQFFLSKDNDLLITTEYEIKKTAENKKLLFKCDLWKANATTGKVENLSLSPMEEYYFNWNIRWIDNATKLEIIGSTNNEDSKDTKGLFMTRVDLGSFAKTETIKTLLPEDLFAKVDYALVSKKTLLNFYLNQVYQMNDGTRILILEHNNASSVINRTYFSSSNGASETHYSSTNTQTKYGDIAIVALDQQGKVRWTEVIKKASFCYGSRYPESKDQKYFKEYLNFSSSSTDFFISYIPVFNGNSVSVIFHDGLKSKDYLKREYAPSIGKTDLPKTLVVKCTFGSLGFTESKVLFDQTTSKNIWRTSMYSNLENKILIYTEGEKTFQWVKLQ